MIRHPFCMSPRLHNRNWCRLCECLCVCFLIALKWAKYIFFTFVVRTQTWRQRAKLFVHCGNMCAHRNECAAFVRTRFHAVEYIDIISSESQRLRAYEVWMFFSFLAVVSILFAFFVFLPFSYHYILLFSSGYVSRVYDRRRGLCHIWCGSRFSVQHRSRFAISMGIWFFFFLFLHAIKYFVQFRVLDINERRRDNWIYIFYYRFTYVREKWKKKK